MVHSGVLTFRARAVAYALEPEIGVKYLVLAEFADRDGPVVEVQRSMLLFPDEDPDIDGLPCLVIDQSTVHNGVFVWTVEDRALRIDLPSVAAEIVGAPAVHVVLPTGQVERAVRIAMAHLVDDGPEAEEFNTTLSS